MRDETSKREREVFVSNALEATIRVGVVLLLGAWCLQIVRPFVAPVLWGLIIAIATRPVYQRIEAMVGGRAALAATIFTLAGLLLVIGPVLGLSATVVDGAKAATEFVGDEGTGFPPPPPESLRELPLVGEPIFQSWNLAHTNLGAALATVHTQIRALVGWTLSAAASAGMGIAMFAAAIVLAAVFHVHAEGGRRLAHAVATRLAGESGPALADLAESTIRGVTKGILGVALIQALLAGVGMIAVGVPGAGLWALVVLILAVVQLPTILVLLPVAIYVFQFESMGIAIAFAVWCVLVGFSDNVLKPILLSRGAEVPMPVIFVGAIGGFVSNGIIGLFVGAIVLSVGYRLFLAWLELGQAASEQPAPEPAET